jgi:hypothetical protein
LTALFKSGKQTAFDNAIDAARANHNASTRFRWSVDQGDSIPRASFPFFGHRCGVARHICTLQNGLLTHKICLATQTPSLSRNTNSEDLGLWAFETTSPFDWLSQPQVYSLEDVVDQIPGPVFIADAQDDMFFKEEG